MPLSLTLAVAAPAAAQTGPDPKDVQAVVDKAYEFLKSRQKADGSFEPARGGPGTPALIAAALIRLGKPIDDPVVAKALGVPGEEGPEGRRRVQPVPGELHDGLAIIAFKEANTGGKYDKVIANATKFVKSLQQRRAGRGSCSSAASGTTAKTRPDMSNTHFMVEALLAAGRAEGRPGDQERRWCSSAAARTCRASSTS